MLASEFTVLSHALARIAAGHFSTRDFTLNRLRAALQFYVLEFPVYRTYVTAAGASDRDRRTIEGTITRARGRWTGPDPEIFDFLRDTVTLDLAANPGYSAPRVRNFALKLQQFTGPLMAKAMEDTAFYRHHRLLALNEVGGDPAAGALTLAEFHARQEKRARSGAAGLTATATHDTKRGEDARVRIMALSELAYDWDAAVRNWRAINAPLLRDIDGKRCPSAPHEYMLYQALIGAWPDSIDQAFIERVQAYVLKAAREGKEETSWTNPNEAYEAGLRGFVAALLDKGKSSPFVPLFADFAARTSLLGALNSLAQLALKALLPGVPDFYQGTELWDLSLVDPDNRRPVDFNLRRRALADSTPDWAQLASHWRDGRVKLALTRQLLTLRHEFADVFQHGAYEPVSVTGPHASNIIVFARTLKKQRLIVAVGRHFAALTDAGRRWPTDWQGQFDLPGQYEQLIGGPRAAADLTIASAFRDIPVTVLR
jgi:(1->4)-alpha-D-glucan 1-alpha-D-glucosylmutase